MLEKGTTYTLQYGGEIKRFGKLSILTFYTYIVQNWNKACEYNSLAFVVYIPLNLGGGYNRETIWMTEQ